MSEILRHFLLNGGYFAAPFRTREGAEAYTPAPDAIELAAPPSDAHLWVNGEWSLPAPPPPPSPSLINLTDRQLRIGLLSAGYDLAVVDAAIDGIADPTDRAIARVWWDRTTVIAWDHPMTQLLMALAGIPENERSALWIWASDISA